MIARRTAMAALLAATLAPLPAAAQPAAPELVHAWTRLAWDHRTPEERAAFEAAGVHRRALLANVEVDRGGAIYVSVPRWLDARIPATLSRVVLREGAPVLEPFAGWAAHDVNDPRAFQSVLGSEIDGRNRFWILDMGFVAGREEVPDGAQKLVVVDIATGQELRRYEIPDHVADRRTSFLNDITIDEGRGLAYISDSGNRGGNPTASGIIVYDFASNTARRVLDRHPAVRNDPTRPLHVDGEPVFPGNPLQVGINGLALSPDGERLWWVLTTGDALYSVPTAVLRDPAATPDQVAAAVQGPVRIGGGADGVSVDREGNVWITNLTLNALQRYEPATGRLQTVASGREWIWPDAIAWDDRGGLHVSTNHLNHGFAGVMDFDKAEPNFRIFRLQTSTGPARP